MTKDPELEELKREVEELERKSDDLETFNLHFKRLAHTLGKSPNRQLKWLVAFLHTDLQSLKEDKKLGFRCELKFLADYGTRHFTKQPPIPSGHKPFNRFFFSSPERLLPDKKDLEKFHKDFSQKVSAFLDQQHAQFELFSPFQPTIHVWKTPEGKSDFYLECSRGEDALQWWLASLLANQGNRLRRCLPCQKLFIANRTDKIFCSSKCRGLHNMRDLRKTSVDRYGKRGRPKKSNDFPEKSVK